MRKLVLVSAIVGSLFAASNAQADITAALGISCSAVGDQRQCGNTSPRSTSPSWDGTPIDAAGNTVQVSKVKLKHKKHHHKHHKKHH